MILETLKFESEISDQKRLIGERERQAPNIENRRESFLSVQAPLGNPVLAVANGLLLDRGTSRIYQDQPTATEREIQKERRHEIVGALLSRRRYGEKEKENGREAKSFRTMAFHAVANSYRP